MTRWLSADEQRSWRALLEAQRLLFDRLERQLQRDAGLAHSDYEVLVRLSEAPERRLRMSDLADVSLSSRSRLSHAVSRLEAAGFVRREQCPADRRGTYAVLTDEGFAALAAAAPGHVEAVRAALVGALSPADLAELGRLSAAIVAHLTGPDSTA
jgi:DNA-binding MarR family transcriptional regulator